MEHVDVAYQRFLRILTSICIVTMKNGGDRNGVKSGREELGAVAGSGDCTVSYRSTTVVTYDMIGSMRRPTRKWKTKRKPLSSHFPKA